MGSPRCVWQAGRTRCSSLPTLGWCAHPRPSPLAFPGWRSRDAVPYYLSTLQLSVLRVNTDDYRFEAIQRIGLSSPGNCPRSMCWGVACDPLQLVVAVCAQLDRFCILFKATAPSALPLQEVQHRAKYASHVALASLDPPSLATFSVRSTPCVHQRQEFVVVDRGVGGALIDGVFLNSSAEDRMIYYCVLHSFK